MLVSLPRPALVIFGLLALLVAALALPPDAAVGTTDTTPPTVSSVAITSNAGTDKTYKDGETIEVTFTFNEAIVVTAEPNSAPFITLTFKSQDSHATAHCAAHSTDNKKLVCSYTVKAGDGNSAGISIDANSLDLDPGVTIADTNGNSFTHAAIKDGVTTCDADNYLACLRHDAVTGGANHKVDASPVITFAPRITSNPGPDGIYTVGDKIDVTFSFSEPISITSSNLDLYLPQLNALTVGDKNRSVGCKALSGDTAKMICTYTVISSDGDVDGVSIVRAESVSRSDQHIELYNASIKDLTGNGLRDKQGNRITVGFIGIPDQPGHLVADDAGPTVDSIEITSTPANADEDGDGGVYKPGEEIIIAVEFNEGIIVTGTPRLIIRVGERGGPRLVASRTSTDRDATCARSLLSLKRLICRYTVVDGDEDTDGIAIPSNKLELPTDPSDSTKFIASIKDAKNDANLDHDSVTTQSGHKVGIANSAPKFEVKSVIRLVSEDAPVDTNLGPRVAAADRESDTLTYALSGTGSDDFKIDGAGQIKVARTPLSRPSYTLTVGVHDGKADDDTASNAVDDTATVAVTVTPDVVIWSGTLTVDDDGTHLGCSISDRDGLASCTAPRLDPQRFTFQGLVYRIDVFQLDTNKFLSVEFDRTVPDGLKTGALHVGNRTYAAARAAGLTVRQLAWLNTGLSWSDGDTVSVHLTVPGARTPAPPQPPRTPPQPPRTPQPPSTPGNSAPTFDEGESATRAIAENSAAGTAIGVPVRATDPDGDDLAYTLGGTDAASFDIDAGSGQLKVKAALDHETRSSYEVTVTVSDGKAADGSDDDSADDSITVAIEVAGSCGETITGDEPVSGTWAADCESAETGRGYARYYTFTTTEARDVTITLKSTVDTYLYLRSGASRSGAKVGENDDHGTLVSPAVACASAAGLGNTDSCITYPGLPAGDYTIEATTYAAGTTGSFTLTVSGLSDTTSGAGPGADTCGETITGDEPVSGTWAADCESAETGRGYARYYTFTTDEARDVTITLKSTVDTYLYLRSDDRRSGAKVGENDDHGTLLDNAIACASPSGLGNTDSCITYPGLPAGDYTIEATTYAAGTTGSFTLTISGLSGTTTGAGPGADTCGETITVDGSLDGTWAAGCESGTPAPGTGSGARLARYYTFTTTEARDVTITLKSTVDTYLYLRSGASRSGAKVGENDDHGTLVSPAVACASAAGLGNTDSCITYPGLGTGTYTIEATTYAAGTTGRFTLTVSGLSDTTTGPGPGADTCGETITGDEPVNGTWAAGCESEETGRGYARYYTFTTTEARDVTITLKSTVDTYLYLRSGASRSGAKVGENDDHGTLVSPAVACASAAGLGNTDSCITYPGLGTGTYTIEATTYAAGTTGRFTLTVSGLSDTTTGPGPGADTCGETITGDEPVNGTWAAGCESGTPAPGTGSGARLARYYNFTLSEERDVTFTVNSTIDSYMYLRSGNARTGTALNNPREDDDAGGDRNAQVSETLAAGDYTLEVTTYIPGTAGRFTLTISGLAGTTTGPGPGADSCRETITGDELVNGTWAAGCESGTPAPGTGSGARLARYYTFTLSEERDVTVSLSSEVDTYLYLRSGYGTSGGFLHENDDVEQNVNLNSEIRETLDAGTYTIEATTYAPDKEGDFTLTVSGLGSS